ncbi:MULTISPECIES: hypothetical protein [Flavobacterium]|uniref:Lipoprotein n=1 Tax=Flavobacterium jumunjinense TaxID=998845 RepID=A0ABV5GIT9_9FLAO|nr:MULTISPECIES: hypothetical protein [Flavobacterium]
MKKNLFFLIICVLNSCSPTEKIKTENKSCIILAEKTINHLFQKESLSKIKFSSEVFFHINLKKLNSNYYLTKISLNGLKPKTYSYKINCQNFKTFIYNSNNLNTDYDPAFFVPDSRSWLLLLHVKNNEIIYVKKIENFELTDNNDFEL